jgi:eukaryotic translation initiation factor 2C
MAPALVDAKRLALPAVQYQNSTATPGPNAQWNLRDRRLIQRRDAAIDMLYVVVLATHKRDLTQQAHQKLYHDIANALMAHGVQVPANPNFKQVLLKCHVPEEDPMDVLDGFFNPNDWEVPPTTQTFMLIALPNDLPSLYCAVKTLCDSKYGLNTICAVQSKATGGPGLASYMSNIALKFTFKLGGDVHRLPGLNSLRGKCTIVMGADVTHPQAGSIVGCPSIAAVVGTVDDQFMRFPGSMRLNPSRQEVIQDLEDMVLERLKHWSNVNKTLKPTSILFYRDGVSESQYAAIQAVEVRAIKSAFEKFIKSKKPNATPADCAIALTFVVVGKRHNTRFFPAARDQHQDDRKGNTNIKPGFVVDSKIVSVPNVDFYLQSHQALKGTARPAHYVMLENGMGLTSGVLQNLVSPLLLSKHPPW